MHRPHVDPGLGRAVPAKMLDVSDHRIRPFQIALLQPFDRRDSHAGRQVCILPKGFLATSPAGVACQIEDGAVDRMNTQ